MPLKHPSSPCAQQYSRRRDTIKSIARYGAAAWAAGILSACSEPPKPKFSSIDLTGADYARDFSLTDQSGRTRSIKDFAGQVVVIFFGYTQCPDVCPTSMAELAALKRSLGADGAKLQAIFITVDPERDTPEVLKAYMTNFDPSFLALRPSPDKLPALAAEFKIYYKQVPGTTPGSYTMDHSAGSYVYDPAGRIRLFSRYGNKPEGLLSDIRLLLEGA